MKIKYLEGKKKNEVAELDDVKAKSLIEDGLAEEVKPVDDMEQALANFENKVTELVSKAATEASKKTAEETIDKITKGLGKKKIVVGPERELQDPQGGFKSSSHFYSEVAASAKNKAPTERMAKWIDTNDKLVKSTTGNTEGNTSNDAGYAVPVQYTGEIFKATDNNIPDFQDMTFAVPMQSSVVKIPVLKNYIRNNTTVANGVVAATISESANITQSKTNWEQISLTLSKEAIIVPVSNELLEDNNVALGSVIAEQAGFQITKAKNGGILQGSTAFTGIIGHASSVNVVRQAHLQVQFLDVLDMYSSFAFDDASYETSVWFAHPTVIPQLGNMTSGNYNIYFPPGGAQDGSVGRLMGRPIIVTGWAEPLGTPGDLILADMKKYVSGYRNGMQSMVSPHVFFLTDEQAFRFTERVCGRPGLSSPITLEDGVTQVSPFVTLGHTSAGS